MFRRLSSSLMGVLVLTAMACAANGGGGSSGSDVSDLRPRRGLHALVQHGLVR